MAFDSKTSVICEGNAGPDTLICGYEYILPTAGNWEPLCPSNGALISLENLNPSDSPVLRVSECGMYEIVLHDDDGICKDTATISFENPDFRIVGSNVGINLELEIECLASASGCENELSIAGASPPILNWEICTNQYCNRTLYSTNVKGSLGDCLYEQIKIDSNTVSTNGFACSNALITGDNFISTLDELFLDSAPDCALGPKCFGSPPTLIPDTTYLSIPVLTGGQWHYFDPENNLIPLMDSTIISLDGTEYLLIIEPGSNYYGPGVIDFTLFESNSSGEYILPTTRVEIEIQYVLEYTYELVEFIAFRIINGDGSCPDTFIGPGSFDDIPTGPPNPCDPIGLNFGPSSNVEYDGGVLTCADYGIDIETCPGEIVTFFDPGEYTYSCIDENGCAFEKIVIIVSDFNLPDVTVVSYECDPGNETYTAEIQVDGPFFAEMEIQGLGNFSVNGSITISEIPNCVVLEGSVYDLDNGCSERFNLYHCCECTNTQSSIDAVICEGESFEILDQSFTQSGNYEVLTTNSAGCDSLISLSLEMLPITFNYSEAEICNGAEFIFYDQVLTAPGEYTHFEINDDGCQDQYTLRLEVFQTDDIQLTESICEGSEFVFYDQILTESGEYVHFEINNNGCQEQYTLLLEVFQTDDIQLTESICEGETYDFFEQDLFESGTYTYNQIDPIGCTYKVILQLDVTALPEYFESATICAGSTIEIGGEPISAAGTYSVVNYDNLPCGEIYTYDISILESSFSFESVSLCEGESFPLSNNTISDEGIYTDTLTNAFGCDSIVQIDVRIDSIDFELAADPSCRDSENGSIQITSIQGGAFPFTYSLNGIDFTNEEMFDNLSVGTYTVQVMDQNSCQYTKQITIEELPEITVEIQDAYELTCEEPSLNLTLNVDESTEVVWSTGNFGKEILIDEIGSYSVTLSNNCQDMMMEFLVEEAENDDPDLIYIPNAFSPNQDQINDEFKTFHATPPVNFNFEVFDRWGNRMFQTNDPDAGWNGISRNEHQNPGVYVYKLEAVINSCFGNPKPIFKKGDVSLIR